MKYFKVFFFFKIKSFLIKSFLNVKLFNFGNFKFWIFFCVRQTWVLYFIKWLSMFCIFNKTFFLQNCNSNSATYEIDSCESPLRSRKKYSQWNRVLFEELYCRNVQTSSGILFLHCCYYFIVIYYLLHHLSSCSYTPAPYCSRCCMKYVYNIRGCGLIKANKEGCLATSQQRGVLRRDVNEIT